MKYPIGGYASGNYVCGCVTCKTEFFGDKKAVQCESCAIEMMNKSLFTYKLHAEEFYLNTPASVLAYINQLEQLNK